MKKQFRIATVVLVTIACFAACRQEAKMDKIKGDNTLEASEKLDKKSDAFYHYSIWWAFVNRIFEGDIDAKTLKTKGDMALGSYNSLDGELIMLDGTLYQAKEDGTVVNPPDDIGVAYVNAAFFDSEQAFKLERVDSYENLRTYINDKIPTKNIFYAFKIHGNFKRMKCGGLHKQDKPYETGLDVLIPNRPVFERENFSGTMVGFFCPDFIGNINVAGYHLHFVSDDKTFAGHVMEFEAEELTVEIDYIYEYNFALPKTPEYLEGQFDKEFQYQKK